MPEFQMDFTKYNQVEIVHHTVWPLSSSRVYFSSMRPPDIEQLLNGILPWEVRYIWNETMWSTYFI